MMDWVKNIGFNRSNLPFMEQQGCSYPSTENSDFQKLSPIKTYLTPYIALIDHFAT
jgi:hypothetical protein